MVEQPAQTPAIQTPVIATGSRVRPAIFVLIALVLVLGGGLAYAMIARPGAPVLVVRPVHNVTGNPAYGPLASASSAVLLSEAEQLSDVEVFQGPSPRPDAVGLDAMLIIWNGRPTIMMWAHRAGGPVLWTGMTAGGEQRIPYDIAHEMHRLGERLRR